MSVGPTPGQEPTRRTDEANEVLRTLRQCRSRLNKLHMDHAAAYADIAVQLLKQTIAAEETGRDDPWEEGTPTTS